MTIRNGDPLWNAADQVAYCLSEYGYAFVEDDKLDALAAVLRSFLTAAGIPVHVGEVPGVAPTADRAASASCPANAP
jgi:hypothetical protein